MLSEQITLDNVDGTDVVYKLIRNSENGSTRIDVATTAAAPCFFTVKHQVQGKGVDAIDRHLLQFSRTVMDTLGRPVTATINLTIAQPRNPAITATHVKNLLANAIDFCTDGVIATIATTANVDALLRGES